MQALSIRQPWAHLIVRGFKKAEVRSWSTPFRGRLAIHTSSAKPTRADEEFVWNDPVLDAAVGEIADSMASLPRSAIVGFVDVVDCITGRQASRRLSKEERALTGGYSGDDWLWMLERPQEIRPVPIDGKLRLWTVPEPQRAEAEAASREPSPSNILGGSAYLPIVSPSRELAAMIGREPRSRRDMARRVWQYIAEQQLQDAEDQRLIHTDRRLAKVCDGQASVSMRDLTIYVGEHLEPVPLPT